MLNLLVGAFTIALLGAGTVLIARLRLPTARSVWLIVFSVVIANGIAMMVAHAFVARWGLRPDPERDGLWAMMDGRANRPFVYRRLAPDMVQLATSVAEAPRHRALVDAYLKRSTLLQVVDEQPMTRRQAIAVHVAYVMVWLAWFGAAMVGAALLRFVRQSSWFESILSATLALCLIPLTFGNGGYLYDSVEALLGMSLVLCATQGWFTAIPFVFGAMLVNKESALLLVPALFPLLAAHTAKRNALIWVAALGASGVAWLFFIRQRYAGQPGSDQEWSFLSNLRFWSRPSTYLKFDGMFGPALPAPRGGNVLILALLLIPLRFGWRHVPKEVLRATVLTAGVMLPLLVISGCMDETRAIGPLFPFLFVICSEGLHQMFIANARPSPTCG